VDQTHYDMLSRDWQATGPEEPLLVGDDDDIPGELSPDGRVLAFYREAAGTARDI